MFGHWVEAKLEERDPVYRNGHVAGDRPRWRLAELLGIQQTRKVSVAALKAIFGSELEESA